MKNLIIFGDIHGCNKWKSFEDVNALLLGEGSLEPSFDKYIFLGDYVDSFTHSNVEILHNLKEIIQFKKYYPEHVVLLYGNHDIQYALTPFGIHSNKYLCSGYRPPMHFDLNRLFNGNKNLFKLIHQEENYLFSHAGILNGWYKRFLRNFDNYDGNIPERINSSLGMRLDASVHDVSYSRGGYKKFAGPLWADIDDARRNAPLTGFKQIAGHTQKDDVTKLTGEHYQITYIDFGCKNYKPYYINI